MKRTHNLRHGFTLIEILVVLALMGLLVGLTVTQFDKVFSGSKESIARTFVKESMRIPLTTFSLHVGRYPTTEEGLQALLVAPAGAEGWRGPYIESLPKDPWAHDYVYKCPGVRNTERYDISSPGPNGKDGDADDIGNW